MNSALTFSMSCTSLHSFLELPKTLSFLYFHMDQAVKITSVSNLCRSALRIPLLAAHHQSSKEPSCPGSARRTPACCKHPNQTCLA
jgi:hypothetical protein